ncbi:uncharacterized protein PHACADRAFT_254131 [Phanerochaete carnosa HHB-10118-sp]|uniref:Uncharacterized protein n=1 Tax=Phanerochaete carnosa (strain HHB-10118-sp) TaxID=650164 RepID=K5X225_PHACS|nr:uncharacterized protein PHACADRAFT_254131 [Phanerochaete carnosa HHB-10118-sp]EKM56807.1 hypothetical protein PHACADRAFT_254131 [Phanerochaete carnosa HHB-10118-sp]
MSGLLASACGIAHPYSTPKQASRILDGSFESRRSSITLASALPRHGPWSASSCGARLAADRILLLRCAQGAK